MKIMQLIIQNFNFSTTKENISKLFVLLIKLLNITN